MTTPITLATAGLLKQYTQFSETIATEQQAINTFLGQLATLELQTGVLNDLSTDKIKAITSLQLRLQSLLKDILEKLDDPNQVNHLLQQLTSIQKALHSLIGQEIDLKTLDQSLVHLQEIIQTQISLSHLNARQQHDLSTVTSTTASIAEISQQIKQALSI